MIRLASGNPAGIYVKLTGFLDCEVFASISLAKGYGLD